MQIRRNEGDTVTKEREMNMAAVREIVREREVIASEATVTASAEATVTASVDVSVVDATVEDVTTEDVSGSQPPNDRPSNVSATESTPKGRNALNWFKVKYREDMLFNMSRKIQSHYYDRYKQYCPVKRVPELLGISLKKFKQTFELRFEEGMDWTVFLLNRNAIHMDHRTAKRHERSDIPVTPKFGLELFEEAIWHWSNYWPTWRDFNLAKSNSNAYPNRNWDSARKLWLEETQKDNKLLEKCLEAIAD